MKDIRRQEREKRMFRREELPRRFTAKKLFGWSDKRYDEEYWGRLEEMERGKKKTNLRNNRKERRN